LKGWGRVTKVGSMLEGILEWKVGVKFRP